MRRGRWVCTRRAAIYCPVHLACTCRHIGGGPCPLHAADSEHAREVAS